ncbi:hypothetical protein AAF712_009665 [Marasmius tenuissimus]|uniref:Uncharacterized protein n=1 Tax=Marasmius tenuissimus TaxID=585030 RepID=A0ABR2ZPF9_9AGAR|nr:hypothetical protein PM082_015542 [Marasmius tenuissimus]KAJ8077507.1 hypothetical protein PM082_001938 [Marasmius tenuissimus]
MLGFSSMVDLVLAGVASLSPMRASLPNHADCTVIFTPTVAVVPHKDLWVGLTNAIGHNLEEASGSIGYSGVSDLHVKDNNDGAFTHHAQYGSEGLTAEEVKALIEGLSGRTLKGTETQAFLINSVTCA